MKKKFFAALLLLPIFLCAQTAKIKIDIDRTIGEIDPNKNLRGIYGADSVQWTKDGIARQRKVQHIIRDLIRSFFAACGRARFARKIMLKP